jgi:hypothetical protein
MTLTDKLYISLSNMFDWLAKSLSSEFKHWSFAQLLRNSPYTSASRILICSRRSITNMKTGGSAPEIYDCRGSAQVQPIGGFFLN